MIRAERIWKLQRFSGLAAATFFLLASLTLFDGLRTGIFGSSDVRLVPGDSYAVSGPMPPKTDSIADFIIDGNAGDGSIRLVPEAIYTGYWFGGGMWRGHICVESHPQPGNYTISVRDKFGEKQNPALVFQVRVFADPEQRRSNSPSMVYRRTGIDAYILAICLGVAGIATAGCNFLLGRQWSAVLADNGCGEIFRIKTVNGRIEAGIEMPDPQYAKIGAVFRFTHPKRGDLGIGKVVALAQGEITVAASTDVHVRLGDIACLVKA